MLVSSWVIQVLRGLPGGRRHVGYDVASSSSSSLDICRAPITSRTQEWQDRVTCDPGPQGLQGATGKLGGPKRLLIKGH